MATCEEKIIKELFDRGAIQVSRKYQLVGVLPENKTGLEMLQEVDPQLAKDMVDRLEQDAAAHFLRCHGDKYGCIVELTDEEFDLFLDEKRKRMLG